MLNTAELEALKQLRSDIEKDYDALRDDLWRRWRDRDTALLRRINEIERQNEEVLDGLAKQEENRSVKPC